MEVDIDVHLLANLSLNAVDLPGGELCRRDELDELTMQLNCKKVYQTTMVTWLYSILEVKGTAFKI